MPNKQKGHGRDLSVHALGIALDPCVFLMHFLEVMQP